MLTSTRLLKSLEGFHVSWPSTLTQLRFGAVESFLQHRLLRASLFVRQLACQPVKQLPLKFTGPQADQLDVSDDRERFKSIVVEPVCAAFSPAQHPASRSYDRLLSFDHCELKTHLGNLIAFCCLAIAWFAWPGTVLRLLERLQLSKVARLPMWRCLPQIGFEEAIINSCACGSIHFFACRAKAYR